MKCVLCQVRISDWQMGKVTILKESDPILLTAPIVAHNACLQDYKLKHGKEYKDVIKVSFP